MQKQVFYEKRKEEVRLNEFVLREIVVPAESLEEANQELRDPELAQDPKREG